ncbi:class III lanthionine synthetase LanKC [Streptomyces sp. NPDC001920]
MDALYEAFCTTDPRFYDRADVVTADAKLFAPLRATETPVGWHREVSRGWVNYRPPAVRLPLQGWKIHVTATQSLAEEVVRKAFDHCVSRSVTFKVVPGLREYRERNAKYGERAGSGKLITVYPTGERELESLVTELGELLHGVPGPYILSDLRWQDGPVYVRYGAFVPRKVRGADGREVGAIEAPDGTLVPDTRGPVFTLPDWATLPDFLRPQLDRRNAERVDSLPFRIHAALHYSNGGGVYEGRLAQGGTRVAVKEGRPHAGLDTAGRDAVTRLRRERNLLERLRGLPSVPRLMGYHRAAGHEFLVEEFVTGEPLYSACGRRNPLMRHLAPAEDELAEYREWAMAVWQRVADAVRAMHARGVVFGDLHMHNVLYPSPDEEAAGDDRIRLIDFEGGWFTEEDGRQVVANSGFVAPSGRSGTAVDEYALAALKLAVFAPMTGLLQLSSRKASHLADVIADRFGAPRTWFDDALAELGSRSPAPASPRVISLAEDAWPAARASMIRAVRDSASPGRDDRFFPGDIAQFDDPPGGLGMAYGAAGVLWALRSVGAERVPSAERWLLDRATHDGAGTAPGFYNGRHGIAHALWELGHGDAALDTLPRPSGIRTSDAGLSLFDGLSGAGLNWLYFARQCGEDKYAQYAMDLAESVRGRLGEITDVPETSGGEHPRAGLMHGSAGPALFLTAVFEETGDAQWLDSAERALRQDLRRCVRDESGALFINEGFRQMPYLDAGSVGLGFALQRYLACRSEPDLEADLAAIRRAAAPAYCVFPGLFTGLAGLVLFNAARRNVDTACAEQQAAGFDWHALDWEGHLAFPGTQLLRMSMDLATGTAGVLLGLAAARAAGTQAERLISLPFLLPLKSSDRAVAPGPSPVPTSAERR